MVDMDNLISLQVAIFCLAMAGYIMTRMHILTLAARKPMIDLILWFLLPCNIIMSFMMKFDYQVLVSCFAVFCVSIAIQVFTNVTSRIFYPHTEKKQLAVLEYGTIVSNAGFLGNPVVLGLYGLPGLLYASIYLIPQRIVMWSAGVSCFTGAKGATAIKRVLVHPCIIAVYIGLILMIFQLSVPEGLHKALTYGSNCVTALPMIVIGNIMAEVKAKEIVSRKILWYCLVRLILIPLLVFAGCRLCQLDNLVTEVSTVLAGMPAATTTAILAEKYKSDSVFAVKVVFLSTALSLLSIPLLCVVMMRF